MCAISREVYGIFITHCQSHKGDSFPSSDHPSDLREDSDYSHFGNNHPHVAGTGGKINVTGQATVTCPPVGPDKLGMGHENSLTITMFRRHFGLLLETLLLPFLQMFPPQTTCPSGKPPNPSQPPLPAFPLAVFIDAVSSADDFPLSPLPIQILLILQSTTQLPPYSWELMIIHSSTYSKIFMCSMLF